MKRKTTSGMVCVIALGALVAGMTWAQCAGSGCGDKAAACPAGACGVKTATTGSGPAPAAVEKQAVLNTAGLAALVRAKTPVTLLDARAGKWDDGKRIAGAKAVNADSSDAEIAAAAPDKAALIVTYCANLQCPASGKLAARLRGSGYSNVIEYPEGIGGWVAAGNEVTETKK